MKKVVLFAGVIGMIAFTSCSKKGDYDCKCSLVEAEISNATEDEAKEFCDDLGSSCTLTKK